MNYYFLPYHLVSDSVKEVIEANKQDFKKTFGEVQPDYNYYDYISRMGSGFVALAVENDSVKGIAGFSVAENANQDILEAENILFFIEKEYRGKLLGDFLSFVHKSLKNINVQKISFSLASDSFGKILSKYGFKPEYTIWGLSYE